ncbi:MAG: hypothetical protein RLZZ179_2113 [Verrucomicrobiota bacterium]|jgi:CxxC motif-containing protein (DUF1111 family)
MRFAALTALCLAATAPAAEKGPAWSGGDGTVFNEGHDAFSLPLAHLSRERRREFVVGNAFFNENWVAAPASTEARDGLGPLFHARSCSGCHTRDGRGAPPAGPDEMMTGLLLRLSIPGPGPHGSPNPHPIYGTQLAPRALPGSEPEANTAVHWESSAFSYPDGTTAALRKPRFTLGNWRDGNPGKDLLTSPRLAPGIFGSGLLEAIDPSTLENLTDPSDHNHDGISGRLNMVWDHERSTMTPGRFGWKANQPTLRQQTADAFLGDMGLTTPLHPEESLSPSQQARFAHVPSGGSPEVSARIFDRVVTYVQTLAVPARRSPNDPAITRGADLFRKVRCHDCHTPSLTTGNSHPLPELRQQSIQPFTDLLLHDMGPELADNRPDGEASGSEWRTPPLWGLGLHKAVNGNTFYLHDGRARSPEEAILWHGGEATASREAFAQLPREERDLLLRFLDSL